jgi:UDP-N-acetyl-D-mannosaminuronate dehydrogenase
VKAERWLNDYIAEHAIRSVTKALRSTGVIIRGAKIAILGIAYKADTEDITNSPAKRIVKGFLRRGAAVFAYDPHTPQSFGADRSPSIAEAIRDSDCIVLVTPHAQFRSLKPSHLKALAKPRCVIFDGPRILNPDEVVGAGFTYLGTGWGIRK